MTTYVTLLRGINVGGKNRLPMQSLTAVLESIGCDHVRTYIQSGNVVFEGGSRDWSELIEDAIRASFGFTPAVMTLNAHEFRQIAANAPFAKHDGKSLHVFFLDAAPPQPDLASIEQAAAPSEQYRLDGRAFYLYAPDGIGKSKLAARAERMLGVAATARNWSTVSKLVEMSR